MIEIALGTLAAIYVLGVIAMTYGGWAYDTIIDKKVSWRWILKAAFGWPVFAVWAVFHKRR